MKNKFHIMFKRKDDDFMSNQVKSEKLSTEILTKEKSNEISLGLIEELLGIETDGLTLNDLVFDFELGCDVGNSFTKTSCGVRFRSRVSSRYNQSKIKNSSDVEYEGIEAKVGDIEGDSFFGRDKYQSKNYEMTLATSIVRSGIKMAEKANRPNVRVFNAAIALGTPAQDHDATEKECRESALKIKNKVINIDGIDYIVNVNYALVLPQSAIIKDDIEEIIVLDFGGGTADLARWRKDTNGFIKVYAYSFEKYGFDVFKDELVEYFKQNKKYNIKDLNDDVITKVLIRKKIKIMGKDIDVSNIINNRLNMYMEGINGEIGKKRLDLNADKLYVVGGCANLLVDRVKTILLGMEANEQTDYVVIDKNSQFSNAIAYLKALKSELGIIDSGDNNE